MDQVSSQRGGLLCLAAPWETATSSENRVSTAISAAKCSFALSAMGLCGGRSPDVGE